MADQRISELTSAVSVNDSDELVVNQGGVTKKVAKSVLVDGLGGGGSTFTMPTALADGTGDAGKLLKAVSGQAAIADETAASPSSPWEWEITINSVGVAGVAGSQEIATIQLVAESAGNYSGAYIILDVANEIVDPAVFWFNTDGLDVSPMVSPQEFQVNIMGGDSANTIMTNLRNAIDMNLNGMGIDNVNDDTIDTLTVTFQQGARNDVNDGASGFPGTLNTTQQGSAGSTGSRIYITDDYSFGSFQVQAGINWTVQGDTTSEASAIATALTNEAMGADPEMFWTFSSAANVITVSFNPTGREPGWETGPFMYGVSTSTGDWSAADPGVVQTQVGSGGSPQKSDGPYIGKLVSVTGGVALIDSNRVITLVNEGAVADGAKVVAASNTNPGRIREEANGNVGQDDIVGVAIAGGADGATSTVLLLAEQGYLFQG